MRCCSNRLLNVQFGPWALNNHSLQYFVPSRNVDLEDFYDNQEWQLVTACVNGKVQSFAEELKHGRV